MKKHERTRFFEANVWMIWNFSPGVKFSIPLSNLIVELALKTILSMVFLTIGLFCLSDEIVACYFKNVKTDVSAVLPKRGLIS